MQYQEIRNINKKESSKHEDITIIKDHLKRINKKLDEGNNRSLENHVALQSPNEIKSFVQIKELILKIFLLIDQDQKNEKIKSMQKESLAFVQDKISELLAAKSELDAILYLGMYQAILNNDTTGVIKLYDKLKNNIPEEEDFEFLMEDKAKDE
jgi:hypothetical protein